MFRGPLEPPSDNGRLASRARQSALAILTWLCAICGGGSQAEEEVHSAHASAAERRLFSGVVVRLPEALRRRGLEVSPEMESHVVLEAADGTLYPILADWRGRAFYQDEELRYRPVTLVARRRPDVGYLQTLMVFTYDEQSRPLFTDYWCDICSIPMYERKLCECCQGDIRMRQTPQRLPRDISWATPEGFPQITDIHPPDARSLSLPRP